MNYLFLTFFLFLNNTLSHSSEIPIYFQYKSPTFISVFPSYTEVLDKGNIIIFELPWKKALCISNAFGNKYFWSGIDAEDTSNVCFAAGLGFNRISETWAFFSRFSHESEKNLDQYGNVLSRSSSLYLEPGISWSIYKNFSSYSLTFSFPLKFVTYNDLLDTVDLSPRLSYNMSLFYQKELSSQSKILFFANRFKQSWEEEVKDYLSDTVYTYATDSVRYIVALGLNFSPVKNLDQVLLIYFNAEKEEKELGFIAGVSITISQYFSLKGGIKEGYSLRERKEDGYSFKHRSFERPHYALGVEFTKDFFSLKIGVSPLYFFEQDEEEPISVRFDFNTPLF